MPKMTDLVISHSMEHTSGVTSASPPGVRGVRTTALMNEAQLLPISRASISGWDAEARSTSKNLFLSSPASKLFQWLFTLVLPLKAVFIDNSSLLISFSFFFFFVEVVEGFRSPQAVRANDSNPYWAFQDAFSIQERRPEPLLIWRATVGVCQRPYLTSGYCAPR